MNSPDAWQLLDEGRFEESLEIFESQISKASDASEKAWALSNSAYPLCRLQRFKEARERVLTAWRIVGDSHFLHQRAYVEREAGDFEGALKLIEQERSKLGTDDFARLSANSYEQAKLRELMGNLDGAQRWAEHALKEAESQNDIVVKACAERVMGDVYLLQHRNDLAREHYTRSARYFSEAGDKVGESEVLSRMP